VKRTRKRLKKLIDIAGTGRDLDICVLLFDDHLMRDGIVGVEVAALRRRLLAARGRSRSRMAEELLGLKTGSLGKDLKALLEEGPEDLFVAMARYRRARDEGSALLLEAMESAGENFDPDALHGLRKAARSMRYVADAGAAFRHDVAETPACFRDLQDALGRVQDANVMAGQMERMARTADRLGQFRTAARARETGSGFANLSRGLHHACLMTDPAGQVRRALDLLGHKVSAA
jgi:CHAD domain-containing protein